MGVDSSPASKSGRRRYNTLRDLRFAARSFRRSPGVTTIAALSLALGIGANTAIFSLIDAVLLRDLPAPNPRELVLLSNPTAQGVSMGTEDGERFLFSVEEFQYLGKNQQVFQDMYASESDASRVSASINGGV